MKKPWIYLTVCFLVSLALCLFVSWPRDASSIIVTVPHRPTLSVRPTGNGTSAPEGPGQVRLYFTNAQLRETMEALAQEYTQQTGIEVLLVESREAATVFAVKSSAELQAVQGSLYDLTDTEALSKLYSQEFALMADGKPVGLAMDVTGYGLIYNASLLAHAGFTRTDLRDFTDLTTVSDMILSEERFYAFGNANFVDTKLASLLYGLTDDPAQLRSFVDLYLQHDATVGSAEVQFSKDQTVFYVGGTWEYDTFADMGIHKLDILPIYTSDGGSLHCICKNYWVVSNQGSAADVGASLDFLNWMVTAPEGGVAPVDRLGYFAPFADANAAQNAFLRLLRKYIATEPVTVRFEIAPGMNATNLKDFAAALNAYWAAATDENWAKVAEFFNS